VQAGPFTLLDQPHLASGAAGGVAMSPNPLRWRPLPMPAGDIALDFIEGLRTWVVNGDVAAQTGMAAHLVIANRSMMRRAFVDADGEMLVVAQQGRLAITTELGRLDVAPGEVALIPRGMAWSVALPDGAARAYICENYGAPFRLPELGPIGSNGLASARDFLAPVAAVDDAPGEWELVKKFDGRLWRATLSSSPFDVVACTATSSRTSTTRHASW